MTTSLDTRNAARSPDIERSARLFHALSDETRLEIVRMLRHGERCVCDLTAALDAAQSRLSFHLKTLKDAGLVNDRRQGRWVYYSLDAGALAQMEKALGSLKPMPILQSGAGDGYCG
jgi:ArsR family transcriptional regulator